MKLDSIIYDANTLSSVVNEKLLQESPTFTASYPSETSTALVNALSAYSAMLQYTMVSAMANCYTDTAYSPSGVYQLAETLGNRLHGNVSSQLTCTIKRTNTVGTTVQIPAHSYFDVEGQKFFNPDAIIFQNNNDQVGGVKLVQGEFVTTENVTSGTVGEKIYFAEDFKCNMNMVKVYINGEEWATTETFLPLNSYDLVDPSEVQTVLLRTSPDGRTYIKFGNNINGATPAGGSAVKITYVSNDGDSGNIAKNNANITLVSPVYVTIDGKSTLLTVEVPNSTVASGGFNKQDLQTLKESSPYVFASGERAVRRDDYKAMLLNKCGYITCNVWGEYEEAAYYGGYDKIMMNMVYYTGIKSLQMYDYKPMGEANPKKTISADTPLTVSSSLGSIRGFPGSYEIDFIYSLNNDITQKYVDKLGTGILVPDFTYTKSEDKAKVYPYNDLLADYKSKEKNVSAIKISGLESNVDNVITGADNGLVGNGKVDTSDKVLKLGFDDPFQFGFEFVEETAIAALQFVAPSPAKSDEELWKKEYIGKFAVYGTKDPSASYRNIKNDNAWDRLVDIQDLTYDGENGELSDWITLKTYDPQGIATGFKKYTRYVVEVYSNRDTDIANPTSVVRIQQVKALYSSVDSNYYAWSYDDKLYAWRSENGQTTVYTRVIAPEGNPQAYDENGNASEYGIVLTYDSANDYIVLNGLPDVRLFRTPSADKSLGIETYYTKDDNKQPKVKDAVYTLSSTGEFIQSDKEISEVDSATYPQFIKLYGDASYIVRSRDVTRDKAVENHKASTINYASNNTVNLCIPYLPDDMKYFSYTVNISGANQENGYADGDVVTFKVPKINGVNDYYFNVRINNAYNGDFSVFLGTTPEEVTNNILAGNDEINTTGTLTYQGKKAGNGTGATIKIASEKAIDIFGNFTGNAYKEADIEAVDYPILQKYNHFTTYVEFRQPRIKNVRVAVQIEYDNNQVYQEIRNRVINAINSVFEVTPYYMGKDLNVSDIWGAIYKVDGIKRFIVNYPTSNIHCEPFEILLLPKTGLTVETIENKDFK
jgi:hypothetical protein